MKSTARLYRVDF